MKFETFWFAQLKESTVGQTSPNNGQGTITARESFVLYNSLSERGVRYLTGNNEKLLRLSFQLQVRLFCKGLHGNTSCMQRILEFPLS
jgi:hypothetical protein